ncbi:MAG: hypothetical protein V4499_02870 [Pseudomonadota bacterium]
MFAAMLAMAAAIQDVSSTVGPPALRPISADEKQAIEDAVSAQVTDATAMRFRLPPNRTVTGDYCGLVDGKNLYGDYVGYLPFHVRITHESDGTITVSDIIISTSPTSSAEILSACARAGVGLSAVGPDVSEFRARAVSTLRSPDHA